MLVRKIDRLLKYIRKTGDYCPPGIEPPEIYRCQALPPISWNKSLLEKRLLVKIPLELELLWQRVSRIHLFEDMIYGQWGLIILAPDEIEAYQKEKWEYWGNELIRGDLIIGEFVGDPDLIVIRCDATVDDFGGIIIAKAIAHRDEWYVSQQSLTDFLKAYLDAKGEWPWETP